MIAAWTRARSLVRQIDGFAPPRWRRDPAWWALIGATATLEARGRRAAGPYLISDGGPGADTFMGAPTPGPTDRAAWIAWAIAAAHAAVTAIDQLDGTLPDQPLAVTIARAGGAAHTRPAPDRRRVSFVLGDRVVSVGLDPRGPAHERALADRLAATLDGRGAIEAPGPPPLVAVTVGEVALTAAHHAHRRAWTAAGGPWLGIARTGGLTAVTTCHLAVDGFGHAALTRAILDGLTAGLAVAPRGPAGPPPPPAPAGVGEHLDVAWRALPSGGRALPLAYALARTLAPAGSPPRSCSSPWRPAPSTIRRASPAASDRRCSACAAIPAAPSSPTRPSPSGPAARSPTRPPAPASPAGCSTACAGCRCRSPSSAGSWPARRRAGWPVPARPWPATPACRSCARPRRWSPRRRHPRSSHAIAAPRW
jgi:hypothetical protein